MTWTSSISRVRVEELLDLRRVDVLAAADDHVLDPPDDVQVTRLVHDGEVAGVHPACGVDHLGGLLRLVPVAQHDRVAAGAHLARRPARQHQAGLRVDHLHLDVRVHPPDRRHPPLHVVIGLGLAGDRGRLGHPVADRYLGHVHLADDPLHHLDRARRSGHDPGPQAGQVIAGEVRQGELGDEHRRHAVQGGAPLGLDRLQRGGGLEARAPGSRCRRRAWCRPGCRAPCRSSGRTAPGCRPGPRPVYRHSSPMKKPLLRMLWWESVAPFGKPVVPLVYWMLIGSSKARLAARSCSGSAPA